jgi:hypothetical protein
MFHYAARYRCSCLRLEPHYEVDMSFPHLELSLKLLAAQKSPSRCRRRALLDRMPPLLPSDPRLEYSGSETEKPKSHCYQNIIHRRHEQVCLAIFLQPIFEASPVVLGFAIPVQPLKTVSEMNVRDVGILEGSIHRQDTRQHADVLDVVHNEFCEKLL